MYSIGPEKKRNPEKRWALPERVFFACGACQVLAHAFLQAFPEKNFVPQWIKPADGFSGNHIFVTDGEMAFDYHGYTSREKLVSHIFKKAQRWWPGWSAEIIEIPPHVLVNEQESKKIEGLWLRQPDQFLHNALPRAQKYLERFDHG